MDHVSHQQHGFQQQQRQLQNPQAAPPLNPQQFPSNQLHDLQDPSSLHIKQQHLYRINQCQRHMLIHQQQAPSQPHHGSSSSNPTLHRPAHPPPPPPAIRQSRLAHADESNCPNTNYDAIVANHTLLRNSLPTIPTKTISYEDAQRNSLQQNFQDGSRFNYHLQPQLLRSYQAVGSIPTVQPLDTRQTQPTVKHIETSDTHDVRNGVASIEYGLVTDINLQEHYTEEVIQAILAAKEALEKPIEERDDRDVLLIDNLCSLVHGFNVFPKSIRRALAAQAVLIVIDEKGKELIVHNEELDSFCVLIFGECEQLNVTKTVPIRYYTVGDAFGVCEPTTDTVRFVGHMVTRCENCAFLCVKRDDFYSILTDPANYPNKELARHRDRNGNIVCISQLNLDKKISGPLWSNRMQSNPLKNVLPNGHTILKATEPYLLMALVDGYDRTDPEYIDDFLLLFRVFLTYDQREKDKRLPPGMIKLCITLANWLDHIDYRDKVVKLILTWLSSYNHDFELNSEFSYLFFRVIESRLLNLSLHNQLHLLHVTLSTKSKIRHVVLSKSSREQPLPFIIAGGYEKNCGIFVAQVNGSNCYENPYDGLTNYLNYSNDEHNSNSMQYMRYDLQATNRLTNKQIDNSARISAQLRPGDQILEVNGTNFSAIKLVEAQKKLDMSTHLSLTLKFNPSAFHEMRALPDGRRKSSLSSVSSVSPYPQTSQKFTFNTTEQLSSKPTNDQYPPISPLFSSNVNFGFKSLVSKTSSRGDRSRLSNLINSSKQLVKQIRDSTQSSNIETMSKTSDNVSDDQSNDIDLGKSKSNPDLPTLRSKDKQIESGLANIVRLDDLNPSAIIDNQSNNTNNQAPVNVLRVFNAANNDSRYLLVHEETTAREVVMVAVKEFNLTGNTAPQSQGEKSVSSLNWHLYEVSVVPESKTIKQKCLSEQTSRLADRAPLCSRYYIKNNSQSTLGASKLDMGDDTLVSEILKENPAHVNLTSLNATLLAVELTLADFDKFKSIEPQQFVYDTFFDCSEKHNNGSNGNNIFRDTASLKSSSSDGQEPDVIQNLNKTRMVPREWMEEYRQFADISNREMFWVICEILNERNIGRRVKIVKQFVRVADVCSQLRNYNSMFAIISGLGHSCVSRLRRTFDKLKPKYKNQLEKMRDLFDPSKNMSNYRICLNQTQPPSIPLFPQIKKDLTFTKEGRSIFVRESNEPKDEDDANLYLSTMRRKPRGDLMSVKSATVDQNNHCLPVAKTRSISYSSFTPKCNGAESDSILINFAEIRQFTERVRNVIYYSSVPYSNDLLTNTKDSQRTQTQIKKMHEEWQMRKRVRHYINQTLNECNLNNQGPVMLLDRLDQLDGPASNQNGKLTITYDERNLYQRSLEVEPELHVRAPTNSEPRNLIQNVQIPSTHQATAPLGPPSVLMNMHVAPNSAATSSPTLSKSSSLSSCSSFNHHLPNIHSSRVGCNTNLSVGKFGTESTESLRKLQALSENVDDWRGSQNGNGTTKLANESRSARNMVTSRIFPQRGSR